MISDPPTRKATADVSVGEDAAKVAECYAANASLVSEPLKRDPGGRFGEM